MSFRHVFNDNRKCATVSKIVPTSFFICFAFMSLFSQFRKIRKAIELIRTVNLKCITSRVWPQFVFGWKWFDFALVTERNGFTFDVMHSGTLVNHSNLLWICHSSLVFEWQFGSSDFSTFWFQVRIICHFGRPFIKLPSPSLFSHPPPGQP